MKKTFNFLLIGVLELMFIPTLIAATSVIKEYNGKVYVIEDSKTFTCSANTNAIITNIPYKNYFVFREIGEHGEFKYNIETENCNLMNESDQNERTIYNMSIVVSINYEWGLDNKIYEIKNKNYDRAYIITEDIVIDENKIYYEKIGSDK